MVVSQFCTILTNMTEDERQYLLRTVAEAHTGLSKVAFKLRRELTPKAPALKRAIKAELQRLDMEDLEQATGRESLPEVRRGGKVVDVDQLLRGSGADNQGTWR